MRALTIVLMLVTAAVAWAKPQPLTPEELEQVRSGSRDRVATFDDAGLYPLMRNAAWWTPGDIAGATVPDYADLLKDPETHRANLFLIEGQLGDKLLLPPLARAGPWDGRVEQWSILVQKNADDRSQDVVAVVLLTDPPAEKVSPKVKSRVRLPARFYKVWTSQDQAGVATEYPVFVGKTIASAPAAAPSDTTTPSGPGAIGPLLIVLLVVAVGYVMLKRSLRNKPSEFQQRMQERRAHREALEAKRGEMPQDTGPPLPENPAEALDELERRKKSEGDSAVG